MKRMNALSRRYSESVIAVHLLPFPAGRHNSPCEVSDGGFAGKRKPTRSSEEAKAGFTIGSPPILSDQ
jgi:hypothetical protein